MKKSKTELNYSANTSDKRQIKKMRMDLGKFLHNYYIKFGEKNYEEFLNNFGSKMVTEYGEPFSVENLRIMEAEYVTFNAKINEKNKYKDKKTSS